MPGVGSLWGSHSDALSLLSTITIFPLKASREPQYALEYEEALFAFA